MERRSREERCDRAGANGAAAFFENGAIDFNLVEAINNEGLSGFEFDQFLLKAVFFTDELVEVEQDALRFAGGALC
ncbi:MAG: hypothetical protein HC895_06245 [Leptolyngbyaceae cyanobacterium SM1_3_5]|nr:hypothetical protein [Leptolyngbyaceae cyanobacterium SM1_3_5]